MEKQILVAVLAWAICLCGAGGSEEKVRVIIDTDMSADCDDAGALAVLHALADAGEAEILGVMVNGKDAAGASAATVDAINTFRNRPELPIGVGRVRFEPTESAYTAAVRDGFPHDQPADGEVQTGAVELYRKLLGEAEDGEVHVVSAGFLSNLRGLIESKADGVSKLGGRALIKAKVRSLTVMGGEYPGGSEFNFRGGIDSRRAGDAKFVFENWPEEVEVVFVGFERGKDVLTGKQLTGTEAGNPVRKAYELTFDSLEQGRASWDQMAVLYAVRGAGEYWEKFNGGSVRVEEDGSNTWLREPDRNQKFLRRKMSERALSFVIGELMSRPPGTGRDALVARWPLVDSAEDVVGKTDGVLLNGASFAPDGEGRALALDGKNDYMELPAVSTLALGGFTVSLWVKVSAVKKSGWRTVFEHGRSTDNWYGLWQTEGGDRFHFRWGLSDTTDFSGPIREGKWQHVVTTLDPVTKEVRLYMDGKLDRKLENVRLPRPGAEVMRVGCNLIGEERFPGMLSDLRVYRRPLTDEDVAYLFKAGRPVK